MNTHGRWLSVVARVVLGFVLAFSGLNKLLHFMPLPPSTPAGGAFLGALAATGYMLPLIAVTEIVGGGLVLAGRLLPLALVLLAPVTVNILAFHLFLAPAGLAVPLVLVAAQLHLAWVSRERFASLWSARTIDSHAPEARRPMAAGLVATTQA